MPNIYKVLGQLVPADASLELLYTVPADTQTIVASIKASNNDPASAAIRISIAVAGEADDSKQYIIFDLPLVSGNSTSEYKNITLQAGDEIRVYATPDTVAFSAFGCEQSV